MVINLFFGFSKYICVNYFRAMANLFDFVLLFRQMELNHQKQLRRFIADVTEF